jgi:hypothetical protein
MAGPTRVDVMYALLALDSYNRNESNDSLRLLSENNAAISKQIGNATFEKSSDQIEDAPGDILAGSKASGFSASYYTLNSKNVLAYRGTDFPTSLDLSQFVNFARDFGNGWLGSLGVTSPEQAGPGDVVNFQPYYAQEFYDAVPGANRQLSLEEKRALIAAGQKVGELESKLEIGRSEKADAETDLPLAQEDLANAQQAYNAALAKGFNDNAALRQACAA